MPAGGSTRAIRYVLVFAAAVAALAVVRAFIARPIAVTPPPTTRTTQAAPRPSPTTQTTAPAPPLDLLDVLRLADPDYPTTQPLDWPVEFADAARVEVDQPVYLDAAGHLWIEHRDGVDLEELLKKPLRSRTHVVKALPDLAHWPPGEDRPVVVYRGGDGRLRLHVNKRWSDLNDVHGERANDKSADNDCLWRQAVPLGDDLLVPTRYGVTRLDLKNRIDGAQTELIPPTPPDAPSPNAIVIYSTGDRAYAWSPWERGRPGSDQVLLLTDDRTAAPVVVEGLAPKLVQLTPLGDGTILSVGAGEDGNVAVKLTDAPGLPRPAAPPQQQLQPLIDKLVDPEPANREKAQRELEALGPAIYPTLQAMHGDLPPEAQMRVERVLGGRFAPTLGGLAALPGPVETIARFPTGGCALRLPGGGTFTGEGGIEQPVVPATVVVRPGRFTERLPPVIELALKGESKLQAVGNEYVIADATLGPRRWVGSRLQNLLGKSHRRYTELIGIDATGRWLFRDLADKAVPPRTLIVDRTLPDVTPRLPAWTVGELDGVGWSEAGLPMAVRGRQTYVLDEAGWRRPKDGEGLLTTVPPPSPVAAADGTTYAADGARLVITPPGAAPQQVDLPAAPARPPTLVFAAGRLFVQTEAGKLLRYRPTRDLGKPLTLEATFDKQIPPEVPDRLWLDPTGRLVFATKTSLTLTFPDGRVPPALANQVLFRGDREEE